MWRNIFYIPISWLYTLGVAVRHQLYDQHLLPSLSVNVPTICVGNLAVGGTGKTPMVEYLLRLLLANGLHPAVLSRGYKRKTRGFVLADSQASVFTIGDEAMQIHTKFPDVPVAVCENRVRGVHLLQKQIPNLDVVVLDDAFQHRGIRCGLKILLTPYNKLYIDDHMLPWGRLRDLPSRALKADAIVITKCPSDIRPIDMRVVDNRLHLPTFQSLHFTGLNYSPIELNGSALVLCGIAKPEYVLEHVRQLCPKAELLAFPDHHTYSDKDIHAILQRAARFDTIVTTEKDYQRLSTTILPTQLEFMDKRLVVLPVETIFLTDHTVFDKQVLTYVRENRRINS